MCCSLFFRFRSSGGTDHSTSLPTPATSVSLSTSLRPSVVPSSTSPLKTPAEVGYEVPKEQEHLKKSAYPNVQYWTRAEWDETRQRERMSASLGQDINTQGEVVGADIPPSRLRGKTCATQDINVMDRFIEDEHGTVRGRQAMEI